MRTNIQLFWDWFIEHEEDIYSHIESQPEQYAFDIHAQLTAINENLVFDIPFEQVDNKRELIVSADGDASLFPLIHDIVSQAPTLERWIIHALRPRTNQMDQAIDLDGLYLEYEDIFFTITEVEFPLQLTIYLRGYDREDNRYIHGYFLLLDTLLGEYNAVTYTETIAIYPLEDQPNVQRFISLRDLFDANAQKKN